MASPGTGTHFFVKIDVLSNTTSTRSINSSTASPNCVVEVENTTLLSRSAKVEATLSNGTTAAIAFDNNGTSKDSWEPDFPLIPAGQTISKRCALRRNGSSNSAEQIIDQLYFQWVTPVWQKDHSYKQIVISLSVS